MARSTKEIEALIGGAGVLTGFWDRLVKEVRDRGGSAQDLHRLVTDDGRETIGQMADLIVAAGQPQVAVSDPYAVIVDHGRTLPAAIDAGNYDWKNDAYQGLAWNDWAAPDGTTEHFPTDPAERVETELVLVHLDRAATTDEVLAEFDRLDLVPAVIPETLAFGEHHPDVQREFPVVGLGSVWPGPDGDRRVVCLWSGADGRCLYLRWYGRQWPPGGRFLGARK